MEQYYKKVLRVVSAVSIYLFVSLFIYLFVVSEIDSLFSKKSEVDLYVTG